MGKCDTSLFQQGKIDVIEPAGRRADEPEITCPEQFTIHPGYRPDQQNIGAAQLLRTQLPAVDPFDLAEGAEVVVGVFIDQDTQGHTSSSRASASQRRVRGPSRPSSAR